MTTDGAVVTGRQREGYVFASPGEDYLQQIGALAYGVSSLEWTVLGDLTALQQHLPAELDLERLVGKSTGQISRTLAKHAHGIAEDRVRRFVQIGAEALGEAAELRNDVLHARPATIDQQQRLYRWTTRPGQQFAISAAHLDDAIAAVGWLLRRVDAARVGNPTDGSQELS